MNISVIGLGYVGAVAAAALANAGHEVLGVDIDAEKIEAFQRGVLRFHEPGLADLIGQAINRGNLTFRQNNEVCGPLGEVVIIATGTPTSPSGAADLTQVESALSLVRAHASAGVVVIMKSSVPPGTGNRLRAQALRGTDLKYASNPEFLREGRALQDWFNPDRIVIGSSAATAIATVKRIFEGIESPVLVTDVTSAEMIKYASNAFLATRISFINEITALCDRVGATVDDVGKGIAMDPRIGSGSLRPGVGYGGSCFPKDVKALDQLALNNNHNFELLRSVITVNNRQRLLPLYALRERFGELSDVRIAILGLAFKPDTDDVREAPSLDLIRALADEDANITAYDPKAREAAKKVLPGSIRLTDDLLDCVNGAQALVLLTEWREIVDSDWATIAEQMNSPRFLFDGRNAVDPVHARNLGFHYQGVGRARTLAAADLQISEDSSLPQTSAGSGNVDPTQGFANP